MKVEESIAKPGILVLVAMSALQPFALNVMAPALPGMANAFDVDYATIQLTLTFYLVSVAVSQFFGGPLSDRFGRTDRCAGCPRGRWRNRLRAGTGRLS